MLDDDGPIVEREQIRTLIAVAEQSSFSAAAAALGVRQPAVSQQVKRLEQKLGRSLFRRTGRGAHPTADGEAILIYARAMIALSEDLRRQFNSGPDARVIRVGLAEDFGRTALPEALSLFALEHPSAELRITCAGFDEIVAAYRDRRLDVCVLVADARIPPAESLWDAPLAWFGRDDLATPVEDPVPLILPPAGPGRGFIRNVVAAALGAERRKWRVAVETVSLATVESALHAGLGVAPLPRRLKPMGRVVALAEGHGLPELPSRRFVLLCRPDADAPERNFCEVLRRAARLSFDTSGLGRPGEP